MKKLIYSISVLTILAVTFTSCKKDDDNDEPTKSNKELLTAGGWITVSGVINPPLWGSSNWFADYEPCEQDNIVILSTDGKYTEDEGATKCNTDDPQTVESGTWTMTADEKSFTTVADGTTTVFVIQSISETELNVTVSDVIDGVSYTNTMKLKHP